MTKFLNVWGKLRHNIQVKNEYTDKNFFLSNYKVYRESANFNELTNKRQSLTIKLVIKLYYCEDSFEKIQGDKLRTLSESKIWF